MINRKQALFLLRRRTLLAAAGVSAVGWLACPVAAMLIALIAGLAFIAIGLIYVLVLVVGAVLLVGGAVAAVLGLLCGGEGSGAVVCGIVALAIGMGLSQLAPKLDVASEVFQAIMPGAQVVLHWFISSGCVIWAWTPFTVTMTAAGLTLAIVLLARHVPVWIRGLTRKHVDCPKCHHRGTPTYTCAHCGATEADLRPSIYGLLHARCDNCNARMPTLELVGRRALERACNSCRDPLEHEQIGRLPVFHTAVVHAGHCVLPQTTLHKAQGCLQYRHDCSAAELANTGSASSHQYLLHTDHLVIQGDEVSLRDSQQLIPGLLSVLERATTADVRRRTQMPVSVVRKDSPPLTAATSGVGEALAVWRDGMLRTFAQVATLTGEEFSIVKCRSRRWAARIGIATFFLFVFGGALAFGSQFLYPLRRATRVQLQTQVPADQISLERQTITTKPADASLLNSTVSSIEECPSEITLGPQVEQDPQSNLTEPARAEKALLSNGSKTSSAAATRPALNAAAGPIAQQRPRSLLEQAEDETPTNCTTNRVVDQQYTGQPQQAIAGVESNTRGLLDSTRLSLPSPQDKAKVWSTKPQNRADELRFTKASRERLPHSAELPRSSPVSTPTTVPTRSFLSHAAGRKEEHNGFVFGTADSAHLRHPLEQSRPSYGPLNGNLSAVATRVQLAKRMAVQLPNGPVLTLIDDDSGSQTSEVYITGMLQHTRFPVGPPVIVSNGPRKAIIQVTGIHLPGDTADFIISRRERR